MNVPTAGAFVMGLLVFIMALLGVAPSASATLLDCVSDLGSHHASLGS